MTKQPVAIFHGGCPDGTAAAWAAKKRHPAITLVAAKHGQPVPVDVAGADVYLLDFSYPRHIIETMVEEANSVTILDHHQTALSDLGDLLETGVIRGEIDLGRSGCTITWEHFFPSPPPALFRFVEDRDLWRFAFPQTRDITAAVSSYPLTVESFDHIMSIPLETLEQEGRVVNRHRYELIAWAVSNADEVQIYGYRVLAANCPYAIGSDVAGVLAENRPFGAYFYVVGALEHWGLRSRADTGVDVAAIAESFGGGGHTHASGFRLHSDVRRFHRFLSGVGS